MIGSMSLSNDCAPNGAFCPASLHQFGNERWIPLKAISMCAMLFWAGEVQAGTCADLYNAIKSEAMYCGFFCNLEKLQLLQKDYEASCIRIVLPPSLFDIDSTPQESTPVARNIQIDVEVAGQALPALSR